MSTRHKLGIVLVIGMLALAGCTTGGASGNEEGVNDLANDTGTELDGKVGDSAIFEMRATEANQYDLVREQPPIKMETSLERANLIRRYEYLNDQSNTHHVYMLSNDGDVIAYEMAQGKVSSVNSKLTNDKQIVEAPGADYQSGVDAGAEGANFKVLESPQMDGSYGENGDAIFFFTPQGDYVEYNGIYVVSEEPKDITSPVTLIDEVEN